jgi:IS1 family transposase/transposase-like protein
MTCRCCNGETKRAGHFSNRNRLVQRYRCKRCGATFSESQPLDGTRIETDKAGQVIRLLVEGVGINATCRLTGLHKETVLGILAAAGRHCQALLDEKIRNVQVDSVQVDEMFCFVHCKQRNNVENDYNIGDQYLFLAIDAKSKLILSHVIGKRDSGNAYSIMTDLNERVAGRFQLTTDSFQPYKLCVPRGLGERVDYAQLRKIYRASPLDLQAERRYSPAPCIGIRINIYKGDPDPDKISTSYIERTNLSVRLFQRRFTRLTLGYSKKIEYLRYSAALFLAHFNFCRKHSTHGQTPAQAANLTDHAWTIGELLGLGNSHATKKEPETI